MLLFGRNKEKSNNKKLFFGIIMHNANMLEKNEGKSRKDAEYVAICLIVDDLRNKPDGSKGQQQLLDVLQRKFPEHLNDVITYIAWSTEKIHLKPEAETALKRRHA